MSDDQQPLGLGSPSPWPLEGPVRELPVTGRRTDPLYSMFHRKPIVSDRELKVTAEALRGWAGKAASAAGPVESSGREIHRAAEHVHPHKELETSQAAADFATQYHDWMGHMAEALRGYGTKLTEAASAYGQHDIAAGNLFGPQRQTPLVNPGGGPVQV